MKHIKSIHTFLNPEYCVNETTLETRYSAGIAIIFDGKVLLGHSSGRRADTASFGISKGGIDAGESKLEAAIRETREEFGIKVPKSLIDKQEYTFVVTSRKYKYNKVVYYYIAEIKSLSQIGLKDLVVPKKQLQIKEVDYAKFMTRDEAQKAIMQSQRTLLQNLTTKGLI